MKRTSMVLAACAAMFGLLVAAGAQILHDGLSTRATPTKMESILARNVRHLAIRSRARRQINPEPPSNEIVHQAMMHFADHCAICHGNDGSGDSLFGKGLYPKPPDLRLNETQKLSDGELFWIIENGVRFTGMPGFGSPGTQDDSWKLVQFIRHLPRLSADERAEMENNNPKSPEDRMEEKQEEDFLNGGQSPPLQPAEHHHH